MRNGENLCTQSGCHAGCCRDTALHGLNPKETLPWLRSLPSYSLIQSPEQLRDIQEKINSKIQPTDTSGKIFVVLTSDGMEIDIQGLCPKNSGAPEYNCEYPLEVCEQFPYEGLSCAIQRTTR